MFLFARVQREEDVSIAIQFWTWKLTIVGTWMIYSNDSAIGLHWRLPADQQTLEYRCLMIDYLEEVFADDHHPMNSDLQDHQMKQS